MGCSHCGDLSHFKEQRLMKTFKVGALEASFSHTISLHTVRCLSAIRICLERISGVRCNSIFISLHFISHLYASVNAAEGLPSFIESLRCGENTNIMFKFIASPWFRFMLWHLFKTPNTVCCKYCKKYHCFTTIPVFHSTWWHQQMETFSALLAFCAVNSPVTGKFASQLSVTRSFDAIYDLRLKKRLNNKSRRRWYETPSCSFLGQCNNT